jgi:hypothetical protein
MTQLRCERIFSIEPGRTPDPEFPKTPAFYEVSIHLASAA